MTLRIQKTFIDLVNPIDRHLSIKDFVMYNLLFTLKKET